VLLTEMFYFVAWRLVEVLNRSGPLQFPRLGPIEAHGVRVVRNELIEHPEKTSEEFRRGVSIRDVGPTLKPYSENRIDRGLFINAQELHDQLANRLQAALSSP
jgi:hypothetical protein